MRGYVFRLYVDGELVDEEEARDGDAAARIALRQRGVARRADRWMLEVWDPSRPESEAYFRVGTDTGGMVAPKTGEPVDLEGLGRALMEWVLR